MCSLAKKALLPPVMSYSVTGDRSANEVAFPCSLIGNKLEVLSVSLSPSERVLPGFKHEGACLYPLCVWDIFLGGEIDAVGYSVPWS